MHRFHLIKNDSLINGMFHQAFCSCEFGVSKPDKQYFSEIYSSLAKQNKSLRKEQIIFVDDLVENVESANAFGIKAHLYENVEDLKSFMKDL